MGERASSVEHLYQQALELSDQQREEFLAALSEDQQELIRSHLSGSAPTVELNLADNPGTAPTIDIDPTTLVPSSSKQADNGHKRTFGDPPQTIGPYKILQQIGQGGMGQVFIGEQTEPIKRRVALKIIKTDTPTREILARFEAERQALAMMDHQNIAKVLDAGITADGRPYFAMELVKGIPITTYCDQHRLTPTQRLELFVQTCRAIQHAHQKGIIHRDIKPSNVLVSPHDGRPTVKVIDFGLAKALQDETQLTDKTLFTQYGQIVGTLEYMSPEQADLSSLDIDTRTDVYSLGVLMYELLTGSTPLGRERVRSQAYDRILRLIREEDAPRLSTRLTESFIGLADISQRRSTDPKRLRSLLRGDLQWIAMKALEKDRSRRYDTAAALADEVQRHLDDEPINARPPSATYRLQKAYRKHKAGFLTAVAVACLLVAGLVGTGAMWWRARSEASRASFAERKALMEAQNSLDAELDARKAMADAEQQRDRAIGAEKEAIAAKREVESTLARSNYFLAHARWDANRVSEAIELLQRVPEHHRNFEWYLAKREFEGGDFTLYGHTSAVTAVAYSPDGSRIASASWDKTINIWDAQTGDLLNSLDGHSAKVNTVTFSPDGQRIASAGADNTIRLWNLQSGDSITLTGHSGPVNCVCFSSGNDRLASGSWDKSVMIWDLKTNTALHTLQGHRGEVLSVAFAPDDTHLASSGRDNTIRLWDPRVGTASEVFKGHLGAVTSVAFSPEGGSIASSSFDRSIRIWDAASGETIRTLKGHIGHVTSVAFSPDGSQLASASDDDRQPGTIRVWNVRTGATLLTLKGHQRGVTSVAFSPSGTRIASAAGYGENTIKLWDARTGAENRSLNGHWDRVTSVAVHPDGQQIASGSYDRSIVLWDAQTAEKIAVLAGHGGPITSLAYSPDGSLIASGSEDHLVKLWDVQSGKLRRTLTGHSASVSSVAVSPDGRTIASGSWDQTIQLWDAQTGQPQRKLSGHTSGVLSVVFSSSGNLLASAGGFRGDSIKIWDMATGEIRQSFTGHTNYITAVAFSPDQSRLATVSSDRSIKLWDIESGSLLRTMQRHTNRVNHIAFSPDGSRLASAGYDNTVRLWDAESGEELSTLRGHSNYVTGVAFSPDGSFLTSSSWDRTVRTWAATRDTECKILPGHTDRITHCAFSPHSSLIVSASDDQTIKLWDLVTGQLRLTLSGYSAPVTNVAFDPTGSRILSYHNDDSRIAWHTQTGGRTTDFADWPELIPQQSNQSPDHRWLALRLNEQICVVDLQFKHRPLQREYRRFKAAFDPYWHLEQAATAENSTNWFAAIFHRAWIVRQDPRSNEAHWRMRMAFEKLHASDPLLIANLPPPIQETISSPPPPLTNEYADKLNFTILRHVTVATNEPITDVSMQEMVAVCDQYPRASYFHTLGVAQYRAGDYEAAIATLYESLVGLPREIKLPGPHPRDLAFLSMSYLQAGQRDVAKMFRDELSGGVQNDWFKRDLRPLAKNLLREVDDLFAADDTLTDTPRNSADPPPLN